MRGHSTGMTLLELVAVLAILSAVVGSSSVLYSAHIRAAHTNEALTNVRLLAELVRAAPGEPRACEPSPPEVPKGKPAVWRASTGCAAVGFSPGGPTRFQYAVEVPGPDGAAFVVVARGDLDGDGVTSSFRLRADRAEIEVDRGLE